MKKVSPVQHHPDYTPCAEHLCGGRCGQRCNSQRVERHTHLEVFRLKHYTHHMLGGLSVIHHCTVRVSFLSSDFSCHYTY